MLHNPREEFPLPEEFAHISFAHDAICHGKKIICLAWFRVIGAR